MYGELEPVPQGEPIPLLKKRLRIGRKKGCDIVLAFGNISGHHALMEINEGYWFIRDLRSRNGIKIAGKRIAPGVRKRLDPGVLIALAKHDFRIRYDPVDLGAHGEPPPDEIDNLFSRGAPGGVGARLPRGPKGHPPLRKAKDIPRKEENE